MNGVTVCNVNFMGGRLVAQNSEGTQHRHYKCPGTIAMTRFVAPSSETIMVYGLTFWSLSRMDEMFGKDSDSVEQ